MTTQDVPQWVVVQLNEHTTLLLNQGERIEEIGRNLERLHAAYQSHMVNEHQHLQPSAKRRQQVQDWGLKAGGGGGLLYLLVEIARYLAGG